MSRRRYNKVCKVCSQDFIAKRSDATFCSPKCRSFLQYSEKIGAVQTKVEPEKETPVVLEKGDEIEVKLPEIKKDFTVDPKRIQKAYRLLYGDVMLFDNEKPPSLLEFTKKYGNDSDYIDKILEY